MPSGPGTPGRSHGRRSRPSAPIHTRTGPGVLGRPGKDHQTAACPAQISMATLIDASVLIAAERGQLDLEALLTTQSQEEVALAAITTSELLHGIHRAARMTDRTKREAFVEQLLTHIPVVPFDLLVARVHARLWARLAARGLPVGAHDLLIGATAIATGARVATRDVRSFRQIPGLAIVSW
jgi:tRNA(fMet)-specific endonuclease VapC